MLLEKISHLSRHNYNRFRDETATQKNAKDTLNLHDSKESVEQASGPNPVGALQKNLDILEIWYELGQANRRGAKQDHQDPLNDSSGTTGYADD